MAELIPTNQPQIHSLQRLGSGPPVWKRKINAAIEAVNGLKTSVTTGKQVLPDGMTGCWARLHDEASVGGKPTYKFTQVYEQTAGVWVDVVGSIIPFNAGGGVTYELNNTAGIVDGTRVWINFMPVAQDGTALCVFVIGGATGLFPVKVTYNSGVDGSPTTQAAYKYDVTDLAGNAIGINLAVAYRPQGNGSLTKATTGSVGVGYRDGATFVLYAVPEVPVNGC